MIKVAIIFLIFLLLKRAVCHEECDIPKIAIIGGGIGGASTSYFLTELLGAGNLKIDLFEANQIGGRLSTVEIHKNLYEAGGTVVHDRNRLMKDFIDILGLEKRPRGMEDDGRVVVWNGDEFVFKDSQNDILMFLKLIYRYKFDPINLYWLISSTLEDFSKIYQLHDSGVGFKNVSSLLAAMNGKFPEISKISIKDYLTNAGYSARLIDELVEAAMVVNYGQDVDIPSFVGMVSLAGAGSSLWSVKGGNNQVPQQLIAKNKKINLIKSRVFEINHSPKDQQMQYTLSYKNSDGLVNNSVYDIVVIATPLTDDHNSTIKFTNFPANVKFEFPGEYQITYATFVRGSINHTYFGIDKSTSTILSCNPEKTVISSINLLNTVEGLDSNGTWKIFSRAPLRHDLLHNMFKEVLQVNEIKWHAYPKYTLNNNHINKFEIYEALYHVNAIEWAASAMEMSAIAGRNVAILAFNYLNEKTCKKNP